MTFIRIKRVTKNGKTYEYRYAQASVRIGRRVKSLHLGSPRQAGEKDMGSPAMYLDEDKMRENQEALAKGTAVSPDAKENALSDRGEGDASE